MSRCARCRIRKARHYQNPPGACGWFTPADPWWIRALAALSRRRR